MCVRTCPNSVQWRIKGGGGALGAAAMGPWQKEAHKVCQTASQISEFILDFSIQLSNEFLNKFYEKFTPFFFFFFVYITHITESVTSSGYLAMLPIKFLNYSFLFSAIIVYSKRFIFHLYNNYDYLSRSYRKHHN